MRRLIGLLAMAVVLSLGTSARATTTTFFNFTSNNDTGLGSKTYNPGLVPPTTVTATAWAGISINQGTFALITSGSASTAGGNTLYEKAGGGSGAGAEIGLGLDSDTSGDHEIVYGKGIVLNFNALTPYTITFGSLQNASNDVAGLYDLTTNTLLGTFSQSTGFSYSVTSGGTDSFLITEVKSPTGPDPNPNILLGVVTVTDNVSTVPEPSTLAIAGLGALGFGANAWRRRRRAKAKA